MKAPYKLRPKNDNDDYPVNENPERLDEVYIKLFGEGGETWLDESIKWLAVTHKSFDHGRRGYNERLAFLGQSPLDSAKWSRELTQVLQENVWCICKCH